MTLPEIFFITPSKPGRWPITAAKKEKTEDKRKGKKKIQKSKSLKRMPGPKCLKRDSGGKNS